MEIIAARPPNYADIVAVFPGAAERTVIFAYAPNIYSPSGDIPPELVAHEQAHIERQAEIGVENWWKLYLTDYKFRYEEELIAHRAEYQHLIGSQSNRPARRRALKHVAKKLCAPLYGRMVSVEQAMKDLTS